MTSSKPRKRKLLRISIRALLMAVFLIAVTLVVLLKRADSRRQLFDDFRDSGAIVNYSNHPPRWLSNIADINWGPFFDGPDSVAYYLHVEGDQVRIGDTLYTPDDAESYLLQQKSLANANGTDDVQVYVASDIGDTPSQEVSHRMLIFGGTQFPLAGTWSRETYQKDWEANCELHQ